MTSPNQLSFLPDDYLVRKQQRRTNIICAVLFLIVLVTIGITFAITEQNARELDKRDAETLARYAEAARTIEQARQIEQKQKRMAHQAELAASLLEKIPRGNILAELTNRLPAGVSLLDFSLTSRVRKQAEPAAVTATKFEKKAADKKTKAKEKAAPPLVQPKRYDVSLKLTGVAYTDSQVAQYINQLATSPLFRDVNLILVEEYKMQDEKVRRFQIEMNLNPDARPAHIGSDTRTAAVELEPE